MPAVAALSPTHSVARDSSIYANLWAEGPYAQGIEGRQILAKAVEVYRHWSERAEARLILHQAADVFSYEPVQAKRVIYVKTRYVYLGKGLPEPFDLDDE
jgi:hypothetical protein